MRNNGGVKKFSVFLFMLVICGAAHAARLDVSRLTQPGEFSASFGAAFETGNNNTNQNQRDFRSGRIKTLGTELDYTFGGGDWTASFSTDNDYADAQVGLKWKMVKRQSIKLDFHTDYGFAWTHNAGDHARLGYNNIDVAARVHGVAGNFQWAFKLSPQYVWAAPKNFWNIGSKIEAMYYICTDTAIKADLDYGVIQIGMAPTLQDRTTSLGLIYNMSETSSINPYVKYHFKTRNSHHQVTNGDDYWKIGIQFSVQF